MDPSIEMCKSLIKWFDSVLPNKPGKSVEELCDGVAMLEVLIQIAPEHFTKLEPKIKKDANSSWRLKVSNLKKIIEAISEFYQDVLTLQLLEAGRPDVTQIGHNNNPVHLAKMLRLILGCAIYYCEKNEEYIRKIMDMEESVQQNIMQAIQQLKQVTGGRPDIGDRDARASLIVAELEAANDAKEVLNQQCQQMEVQIQNLVDEKQNLVLENQMLKDKDNRSSDLRKQNEALKEELFKVEAVRDDYKAKNDELQRQIKANQEKIADLQVAASDRSKLKDDLDALSETALKVQTLETTLASYQKKLEKYTDIKKELQKLEEKNMEYIQKNLQYEEELSKTNSWKNQCETYKKQLAKIEQKLDEETQRADKAQFNCENLEYKLTTLQGERDRIIQERDLLKEEIDELKLGPPKDVPVSKELTPTEMKAKLRYLEKENKSLRASIQETETNKTMLENALNRIDQLTQQKRSMNQVIVKLEAQIEEANKSSDSQQNENLVKGYKEKITSLQEMLTAKESEVNMLQSKYTRNLEKAREIAQQLESKTNGNEADSSIQHLPSCHMKEEEKQLLITAFHRMGLNCTREAMDERLDVLRGGQGHSFLARQRQPTPRKQIQRFKSK